ncbi:sugar kinase [Ruminiclostridium cellulolyticum]|uniref:PfkB domain protein n=1 Tax=Ruminiclostridium cellulolyticum (strain ATCC 35319 / DSM 5812 / JCM 6584 / H10) TaxID=394503 RepID=B8I2M9_RUMCH|nr:sugar kinase [Ruminiclostridium cellulolyticum]ACL76022.1 PfkB domain protein [Ruminiclostridium cellulolyticum H10]
MEKNFDIISFGEMMLRLSPPGKQRFSRSGSFEKQAGGSELNIAAGVAALGLNTAIISRMPVHDVSQFIMNEIRALGVADDYIIYDKNPDTRLGIYYYESGASPRKPSIIYDRKGSAINRIKFDEIPPEAYGSTRLFHTSGITLALGEATRSAAQNMMKRFKEAGAILSFDVNYRANLWSEDEARRTIEKVLPLLDILFISEETTRKMFRKTGELHDIMKSYCSDYGIPVVATTERKVIGASQHSFSSTIYSSKDDRFYNEHAYEKIEVVDRIGSGDAYVAGVLFGMLKYTDLQKALEFGNAMAAVKSTIPGDLIVTSFGEIERIIKAHQGEQQSEMNR